MAKKKETPKAPLTQIPLSIMGLREDGNLSEIAKNVNSGNLDSGEPKKKKKEKEKPVEESEGQSFRGKNGGRPKKLDEDIVNASGSNEWDRFMDYTSQFYAKNNPGMSVYINEDVKKFFESMKLVCGPKVDIRSMINAALRVFMDKYKDDINQRIKQQLIGE